MSPEDQAQALDLRVQESNNARARSGKPVRYKPDDAGYGPEFCAIEACGAEMPTERRAWGFKICVECKSRLEKASAHRRH